MEPRPAERGKVSALRAPISASDLARRLQPCSKAAGGLLVSVGVVEQVFDRFEGLCEPCQQILVPRQPLGAHRLLLQQQRGQLEDAVVHRQLLRGQAFQQGDAVG